MAGLAENTYEFTLSTVTPVHVGGALGQQEVYASKALRGALRFWYRAYKAGVNPELARDTRKLYEEEKKIFGGVKGTGQRSNVTITLSLMKKRSKSFQIGELLEAQKNRGLDLSYLLAFLDKKLTLREYPAVWGKKGWEDNLTFNMTLSPLLDNTIYEIEAVIAFWLWLYLGGLGLRAHRGFGNFQTVDDDRDFKVGRFSLPFIRFSSQEDVQSFFSFLSDLLPHSDSELLPPFPILVKGFWSLYIKSVDGDRLRLYSSPYEALSEAAVFLKDLRQALRSTGRKAFFFMGRPVSIGGGRRIILRRSSPLFIRVWSLLDNEGERKYLLGIHFFIFNPLEKEDTYTLEEQRSAESIIQEERRILLRLLNQKGFQHVI